MTAFCQYAFDGIENPTVAPDIVMTFGMMKASVDPDRKHYQEVCEQNRINALKKTSKIFMSAISLKSKSKVVDLSA